jgi:hypothetical protein
MVDSVLARQRGVRDARTRQDGSSGLTDAELETAVAIERRLEDEGLTSPAARTLRERAVALIANRDEAGTNRHEAGTKPNAVRPSDDEAEPPRCVAPHKAGAFALGMLEACGVVRAVATADRPGRLRAVRWWWLEPPELARIPTRRLISAALERMVRGSRRSGN